jgi:hypothetical protein
MIVLIFIFAIYELSCLFFSLELYKLEDLFIKVKTKELPITTLEKSDFIILLFIRLIDVIYFIACFIGLFTDTWLLWLVLLFMSVLKQDAKKRYPESMHTINVVDCVFSFILLSCYFIAYI